MRKRSTIFLCFLLAAVVPSVAADRSVPRLSELVNQTYFELAALAPRLHIPSETIDEYEKELETQQDEDLNGLLNEDKKLQAEDDQAHAELGVLNKEASTDTPAMAAKRQSIHCHILGIESHLEENKAERSLAIPFVYDNKTAKLEFVEQWPARKLEIEQAIASGHARDRRHGDIDDIGFRRIGIGQGHDIKLGEQCLRELVDYRLIPPDLDDKTVQNYIQHLADHIAANSDLRIPVHAVVLDSQEINAFGLPGGLLLVDAGLVQTTDTEAELAGVLSHEIAHIAARHGEQLCKPTASISKMLFEGIQMAANAFTGGAVSEATSYAREYLGLGVSFNLSLLGVSRATEAEADQLGIQYAWRSGYDPRGFMQFYDKMASDPKIIQAASFFRTHPPSVGPILTSFSELEFLPKESKPVTSTAKYQDMKRLLETWARNKADQERGADSGPTSDCVAADHLTFHRSGPDTPLRDGILRSPRN